MAFLMILITVLTAVRGTVTQEEIRRAVEACVRQRTQGISDSITVDYRSAIPLVEIHESGAVIAVRDEGITVRKGNVSFPVEIVAGSAVVNRFTVSVTVRTFGLVAVASRQIDRHELVRESDVEVRFMETTSLPADVIASTCGIVGKRTKKILREGSIVTARWLERPPDVRRQETVKLVAKGGAILLSTAAVALDDGRIGEDIRVRRKGASGSVAARIIDAGTVQITLGDREYAR